MRYGLMMLAAGALALALSQGCFIDVETFPERSVVTSTGSGGVGGAGGATSFTTGELGDRCNENADCVEGLECYTEDPGTGAVVAGGMCTTGCTTSGDCPITGECVLQLCALRCPHGGTDPSKKCYARADMACSASAEDGQTVCVPRCVRDSQCPSGFFCQPGHGICGNGNYMGDPPGTQCFVEWPSSGDCRGACLNGICVEVCIVGQDTCPSASWEIDCVPDRDDGEVGDAGTCLRECCRSGPCPGLIPCNRSYEGDGYCSIGGDTGPDVPCPNG